MHDKGLKISGKQITNITEKVNILYRFGLWTDTVKHFVDYIAAMMRTNPRDITSIRFKEKDNQKPIRDYGMVISCENAGVTSEKKIFWTEGMGEVWSLGLFRPTTCDYCDDICGENGDGLCYGPQVRQLSEWAGWLMVGVGSKAELSRYITWGKD